MDPVSGVRRVVEASVAEGDSVIRILFDEWESLSKRFHAVVFALVGTDRDRFTIRVMKSLIEAQSLMNARTAPASLDTADPTRFLGIHDLVLSLLWI